MRPVRVVVLTILLFVDVPVLVGMSDPQIEAPTSAAAVQRALDSHEAAPVQDLARRFVEAERQQDYRAMHALLIPEQRAAIDADTYAAKWREIAARRQVVEVGDTFWPMLVAPEQALVYVSASSRVRRAPGAPALNSRRVRSVRLKRIDGVWGVSESFPEGLPGWGDPKAVPSFAPREFLDSWLALHRQTDELRRFFAPDATLGAARVDLTHLARWLDEERGKLDSLGVALGCHMHEYLGEADGRVMTHAAATVAQEDRRVVGAVYRFEVVPGGGDERPWRLAHCEYAGELHEPLPRLSDAGARLIASQKSGARAAVEAFLEAWKRKDWDGVRERTDADAAEQSPSLWLAALADAGHGLASYTAVDVKSLHLGADPLGARVTAILRFETDDPPQVTSGLHEFTVRGVSRVDEAGIPGTEWLVQAPANLVEAGRQAK